MAKTSSKSAKGKTERKKKSGNGHTKPTAEQQSDQQRQALLFSHKRKIVPLLEAEKAAKAAVQKAYEFAKAEGVPKKEIKLLIQLGSEEGIEAIKNEVERTHRIARWLGIGKQLDLFGEKETLSQRHFEDGRRAALNDQPAKPPLHLVSKDQQTWLEGHAAGRQTLNTQRIQTGFKTLGEAAGGVVPERAADPTLPMQPIGTEPPTHAEVH